MMGLTRPSNQSADTAPQKVELFYSVSPDVVKPTIEVQTKLTQFVKTEAMERVSRGESLTFRLSIAGLFEVSVTPGGEGVPLPRRGKPIEFIVRRKDPSNGASALVKEVSQFLLAETAYPSAASRERYEALVGLNGIKRRVLTMLLLLFSEEYAHVWIQKHHPEATESTLFADPYPVFVFDGHPGLGKTELAKTIGDPLARSLGTPVISYSIGLQLRGGGLVGELTQNICKLIEFAKLQHSERGVPILVQIDEIDALGQAREGQSAPQHHEDSAGVNTLLEQIDTLRDTPGVCLLFTTNRHGALDSALASRTNAHWVTFPLPGYGARLNLLTRCERCMVPPRRI